MTDLAAADAAAGEGERTELHRLVVVLLFALVFAVAVRPALDYDLWFHLRTGQWMVRHHAWVGVDPFQYTRPGVERVQTDWLADLGLYGLWRTMGLPAVSLLVASLATLGTACVYRATTGRFGIRVAATACAAAAASIHWVSRPQMFTFALTAALVLLVTRWRADALATGTGARRIWWVVPLILVGSNLHGGIVYAVLILLGMVLGAWLTRSPRLATGARWQLTLAAATAVAAMSVNPSGLRIYGLPFHQVSTAVEYVSEFRHPSPTDVWTWPFFALLVVAALLVARTWRRLDLVMVLPLLGTAALALQFVRSIPFFAIVAAPFVAEHGSAWWTARRPATEATALTEHERRRLRQAVALVVVAVVVTTPFRIAGPRIEDQEAAMFPVGAVDWLNANRPPGELFNEFDWGGYLMLRAPDYRVAIDGRTDVYDDELATLIETSNAAPGWAEELDGLDVGTVLVHRGVGLDHALRDAPGWALAYEDELAVVHVRR